MATIEQDGTYQTGEGATLESFQFRKGHVVPDGVEYKRVADFPEAAADAKAEAEPENKKAAAPENKSAKGDAK